MAKSLPMPAELRNPPATLTDLLALGDDDFVRAAYRTVLGRPVDESGLQNYVAQIRRGVSKERVVAELALSPEGRARQVLVPGLAELLAVHAPRQACWLCRLLRRLFAETMEPLLAHLRMLDNRLYRLERASARLDAGVAAAVPAVATPARRTSTLLAQPFELDDKDPDEIFEELARRVRTSDVAAQLRERPHRH